MLLRMFGSNFKNFGKIDKVLNRNIYTKQKYNKT